MKPMLTTLPTTDAERIRAERELPAGTWTYRGTTFDEEGFVHRFAGARPGIHRGICALPGWRPDVVSLR